MLPEEPYLFSPRFIFLFSKNKLIMRKFYSVTLVLIINFYSFVSFAQIPPGYYDNAEGLTGYTLKTALFNIIKNHQDQGYSALWDFYKDADIMPPELTNSGTSTNRIWDIYSFNPNGNNPYEFVAGSDQCGSYSGEGDCYNREHTFPKSWFNNAAPMKNDAVHILPTDGYVNGRRSNWPYSEVNNTTWVSENGSKLGHSKVPGYSGTAFEPIDEFKGDLARIYFYMATRYQNKIANWESNSSNADAVLDGTSDHVFEDWYLNLMVKWSNEDPVSAKEINRNNEIYQFQHNRNPFVDHPEYIISIWVDPTSVKNPLALNLSVFPNPVSENLHVNYSGNDKLHFYVYNITGQKVMDGDLTGKENTLSFTSLNKGLFILMIKDLDNGKVFRKKILKPF